MGAIKGLHAFGAIAFAASDFSASEFSDLGLFNITKIQR